MADGVSAVSIETNQPEASASVATDNYLPSNERDLHGDEEKEEDDEEADDSGLWIDWQITFYFIFFTVGFCI